MQTSFYYLGQNFEISKDNDKYQLSWLKSKIESYERLFPYRLFFSHEVIIKSEICTICGNKIGLRTDCGHKIGKLYMGKLCMHEVTDMKIIGFSVVKNPVDKENVLYLIGEEYDYSVLDSIMKRIPSPYTDWDVEFSNSENQNETDTFRFALKIRGTRS